LAERGGLAFVGLYLGAAAAISFVALWPFRRGHALGDEAR
jgi:hypothetical protein